MEKVLYDEGQVCYDFQGGSFCAHGAIITNMRCFAYIGKDGQLTNCKGEIIGEYRIVSGWKIWSYVSNRMYQIETCTQGIYYTGRSFGRGMYYKARRKAAQKWSVLDNAGYRYKWEQSEFYTVE